METRTCKECKQEKPLTNFVKAKVIGDKIYYRHYCGSCYGQRKKPRMQAIREEVIKIKKSCKCKICGENDFRVLEFDHLDDKNFNIGDAVNRGYSLKKIKKEMSKCQVLCANCHRRKTWDENQ